MRKWAAVYLVLLAFVPETASAYFKEAGDLADSCSVAIALEKAPIPSKPSNKDWESQIDRIACMGYMLGVWHSHLSISPEEASKLGRCWPTKIQYGDLALIFVAFLERNPHRRGLVPHDSIVLALYDAFPCKQ